MKHGGNIMKMLKERTHIAKAMNFGKYQIVTDRMR